MNESIFEEWLRKRDKIVPVLRESLEDKLKELGLTFESYCELMTMRFMELLQKDPDLWDFDLMEEYQ